MRVYPKTHEYDNWNIHVWMNVFFLCLSSSSLYARLCVCVCVCVCVDLWLILTRMFWTVTVSPTNSSLHAPSTVSPFGTYVCMHVLFVCLTSSSLHASSTASPCATFFCKFMSKVHGCAPLSIPSCSVLTACTHKANDGKNDKYESSPWVPYIEYCDSHVLTACGNM